MKKVFAISIGLFSMCLLSSCGNNPYEGHEFTLHKAQDPTCTKDGNIAYCTCSYCDDYFDPVTHEVIKEEEVFIPRLGHKYGNIIPASESTCTEHGLMPHYECARCGGFASLDKKATSKESLYLPFAHQLTLIKEVKSTFSTYGVKEHYHCSKCERDFLDVFGEEEELDLTIPRLTSFDKELEFNHTGSGLPYQVYEDSFDKVTISETYMDSDTASALSALNIVLKDYEDVTKRFKVEVDVTSQRCGDAIGIGLTSRSTRADGGVFRSLYGIRFAEGAKFTGICLSYGDTKYEYSSMFTHSFGEFNFVQNLDGTYTFKIKLIRDDNEVRWYINGVLCGRMPYSEYTTNILADDSTYIGFMVRNSNRVKDQTSGLITDSGLHDSYVFSNWRITNDEQ